jgi:hypothetical protein
VILLSSVSVRRGVILRTVCRGVGLCTVTWRGEKYRVECTPSHLLALAVALAGEGRSYVEIYKELARQVLEVEYREATRRVEELLKEK